MSLFTELDFRLMLQCLLLTVCRRFLDFYCTISVMFALLWSRGTLSYEACNVMYPV